MQPQHPSALPVLSWANQQHSRNEIRNLAGGLAVPWGRGAVGGVAWDLHTNPPYLRDRGLTPGLPAEPPVWPAVCSGQLPMVPV